MIQYIYTVTEILTQSPEQILGRHLDLSTGTLTTFALSTETDIKSYLLIIGAPLVNKDLTGFFSSSIVDPIAVKKNVNIASLMVLFVYVPWAFIDNVLYPNLESDNFYARLPIGIFALVVYITNRFLNLSKLTVEVLVFIQCILCMSQQFYFMWVNNFNFVFLTGILIVGAVTIVLLTRTWLCFLFCFLYVGTMITVATIHGWNEQMLFFLAALVTTLGISTLQMANRLYLLNSLVTEREGLSHQMGISQAMSTAFRTLAHDLKAPLTAIKAILHKEAKSTEHGDLLSKAIDRVDFLASRLLNVGKYESSVTNKSNAENLSTAEIFEVLKFIKLLLDYRYENRIIFSQTSLPNESFRIDRMSLERIAMNLLVNAIEASSPDQSVEIRCTVENQNYHLSVIDSGPGLPVELEKRILTSGYSTKGANGNGLGLISTRLLLEKSTGHLIYQRNSPTGAKFTAVMKPSNIL